jgi:type IV pilus assembly protein PilA
MFTARMLRPKMPMTHRRHRGSHAGFTLIEVMVVVAIVGVMAALAVFGVRKLLTAGKAKADADDAMLAMASAIRTYYDRNRGYLDCSTDYDDFYPMTPNGKKHVLNNAGHGDQGCWSLYGVRMGPTYMSFAVRAGTKNDTPPLPSFLSLTFPKPKEPWFVLVGTMDLDGDGVYARYLTSSFSPGVIHRTNEGE